MRPALQERAPGLTPLRRRKMQLENQRFCVRRIAGQVSPYLTATEPPAAGTFLRDIYDEMAQYATPRQWHEAAS